MTSHRRYAALAVVLTVGMLTLTPPAARRVPEGEVRHHLSIVAHRGDLDRFPENTKEAVWAAAALRPDGIEFDVHRSADGTWWVIHDETLDRTTNGTGAIAKLADRIIGRAVIDDGLGFSLERHHGLRVPRLRAVLAGLRDFQGRVYMDLHHATTGHARELLALAAGVRLAIICRTAAEAAAVNRLDAGVETLLRPDGSPGMGVDSWLLEMNREATAAVVAGADRPITTFINEKFVEAGELPLLQRAWAAGVDAYITKHPAAALAARDLLDGLLRWLPRGAARLAGLRPSGT